MIHTLNIHIKKLDDMKKYPDKLSYIGNLELLKRTKLSIIGSRKPNQYSRHATHSLSQKLSNAGVCIVSGAAMGIDAIAHIAAGSDNTISIVANGLKIRYPSINRGLIQNIEEQGLVMSQFEDSFKATPWSFVVRNELVVALGDALIVTQADVDSGSMRSVEFALKMKKKIYVLPHRIGESEGTNRLLDEGLATPIYDVDRFVSQFGQIAKVVDNPFLQYCAKSPTLDSALDKYGSKVYEAELEGKIEISSGTIYLC